MAITKNAPATAVGPASVGRVEAEVVVSAGPERAWDAFVKEAAAWWPKEMLALGAKATLRLEPHVGGRLFEEIPDGDSILWGTVATLRRPKRVEFACDLFPAFGGPTRSHVSVTFEAVTGGTRVRLSDDLFGRVTDTLRKNLREGWTLLLTGAYKAHVESKAPR